MLRHFAKPIAEIIRARHSVRTYCPEALPEKTKMQLKEYAMGIRGPFSPKVRIELIDNPLIAEKAGGKIGTYGIIKGARDYAAAIVETGEKDLEQLGFVMEKFILYATSLDLGTCWLGGTFNKSQFGELAALKKGESLPAVTPIGHAKDRKSVLDSLMRLAAGSDRRKSWAELFYDESFSRPLHEQDAGECGEALEAVRLAPSASNKQPWRVLIHGEDCHFYMLADKPSEGELGFNIHRIDMGIAMCHFEMVMEESGAMGSWKIDDPKVETGAAENLAYIVSWKRTLG